jgi:hypothetical protein
MYMYMLVLPTDVPGKKATGHTMAELRGVHVSTWRSSLHTRKPMCNCTLNYYKSGDDKMWSALIGGRHRPSAVTYSCYTSITATCNIVRGQMRVLSAYCRCVTSALRYRVGHATWHLSMTTAPYVQGLCVQLLVQSQVYTLTTSQDLILRCIYNLALHTGCVANDSLRRNPSLASHEQLTLASHAHEVGSLLE